MKLSEFKKFIKEEIVEILSEEEGTISTKDETKAEKLAKKGLNVTLTEEDEDKEPTKAELAKEKVKGAPSKFKIPNSDFEDFKLRLKTLVTKVKAMDKGVEKDKKMAALKQFIKKPELIKAFKERDVQIDTGGLVG